MILIPTYKSAGASVHRGTCREGEKQTQKKTSIKPYHHTSKQTDPPYHQGWMWNKSGKRVRLEEDNLLFMSDSPWGMHTDEKLSVGKINVADRKTGCCKQYKK